MCPNCGMTITLEKRRNIDFNLIKDATKNDPKSFTNLLRFTKLPRKTLALRLKAMCKDNILVKEHGKYKLNGVSKMNGQKFTDRLPTMFGDRRFKTGLMIIALLIFSSTSGYALARFLATTETPKGPTIIGTFTMALEVSNVADLYSWQAFITFNSSQLETVKAYPGDFVGLDYPLFLNATDIGEGRLLLGGTLSADVNESGKSTTSPKTLAFIVFGYYERAYENPELSFSEDGLFQTFLLDSKGSDIPVARGTLTLSAQN